MAVRLRSGGCHSWSPSLDGRQYPLQTATLKYFLDFIFNGEAYINDKQSITPLLTRPNHYQFPRRLIELALQDLTRTVRE
jgi:hypothetical protein